jgi:hypothetical protein
MKRIVEATYASQNFEDRLVPKTTGSDECDYSDSGQKLACRWQAVVRGLAHDDEDMKDHHLNTVSFLVLYSYNNKSYLNANE